MACLPRQWLKGDQISKKASPLTAIRRHLQFKCSDNFPYQGVIFSTNIWLLIQQLSDRSDWGGSEFDLPRVKPAICVEKSQKPATKTRWGKTL